MFLIFNFENPAFYIFIMKLTSYILILAKKYCNIHKFVLI